METQGNTSEQQNVKNFLTYSEDVRVFYPQMAEVLAQRLTDRSAHIKGVKVDRERVIGYWKDFFKSIADGIVQGGEE